MEKSYYKNSIIVAIVAIVAILVAILFIRNYEIKKRSIHIQSMIDGTIEYILPDGQKVKKGEIVLIINDNPYKKILKEKIEELDKIQKELKVSDEKAQSAKMYLAKTQNDLKAAKSALELANSDYIRYKNEYESGSVTKNDLAKARNNLDVARNEYIRTQKNIEKLNSKLSLDMAKKDSYDSEFNKLNDEINELELKLSYATITSPIDGRIDNLGFNPNDVVEKRQIILTIVPD